MGARSSPTKRPRKIRDRLRPYLPQGLHRQSGADEDGLAGLPGVPCRRHHRPLDRCYFTATVQPRFHSRLVEAIINTVIETTETLLANPDDYNAPCRVRLGIDAGAERPDLHGHRWLQLPEPHDRAFPLSALFNVPHGAGLSVVIPAWMKWYHGRNPAQFERFAKTCSALPPPSKWHCRAREMVRQDRHPHTPGATGHHRGRSARHDRERAGQRQLLRRR